MTLSVPGGARRRPPVHALDFPLCACLGGNLGRRFSAGGRIINKAILVRTTAGWCAAKEALVKRRWSRLRAFVREEQERRRRTAEHEAESATRRVVREAARKERQLKEEEARARRRKQDASDAVEEMAVSFARVGLGSQSASERAKADAKTKMSKEAACEHKDNLQRKKAAMEEEEEARKQILLKAKKVFGS